MRCRKCGAQIPTDSKYCNYCGAVINRIQTRDGSMPVRPRDENFDEISTVREKTIEEPEKQGVRPLGVFLIVLAALVLTAAILPVYSYIRKQQKPIPIPGGEDNFETAGGEERSEDPTEEPGTDKESETAEQELVPGDRVIYAEMTFLVTEDGLMLERCSSKASVIRLPQSIRNKTLTEIGPNAFDGCSHLNYLQIPEGVTVIGEYAFARCGTSIREIAFPSSLKEIKDHVFDYTNGFTIVSMPGTYAKWLADAVGFAWREGTDVNVPGE